MAHSHPPPTHTSTHEPPADCVDMIRRAVAWLHDRQAYHWLQDVCFPAESLRVLFARTFVRHAWPTTLRTRIIDYLLAPSIPVLADDLDMARAWVRQTCKPLDALIASWQQQEQSQQEQQSQLQHRQEQAAGQRPPSPSLGGIIPPPLADYADRMELCFAEKRGHAFFLQAREIIMKEDYSSVLVMELTKTGMCVCLWTRYSMGNS